MSTRLSCYDHAKHLLKRHAGMEEGWAPTACERPCSSGWGLTPMVLHRRVVLHAIGSFLSGLAFVSPLHPPLARLALKRPCHLVCAVGGSGNGGGAGRHRQDAADG